MTIIVISALSLHGTGSGPGASASSPAAANAAASPAATNSPRAATPMQAVTVMMFTGSGEGNTPWFTVTSTWKVVYSFNCANFGQPGGFQVTEDGGTNFALSVNDLAMSNSSSTWAYDDGGTHYLQINSECAWKVKVVDEL